MSYEYQGFKEGTLFTLENKNKELFEKDLSEDNIIFTTANVIYATIGTTFYTPSDYTKITGSNFHKLFNREYKIDKIEEIKRHIIIEATDTNSSNGHICIEYDTVNAKEKLHSMLTKKYSLSEVIEVLQNDDKLRFRQYDNECNILSVNEYNELKYVYCDWDNDIKKYESINILDELDINSTFVLVENKEVTFIEEMRPHSRDFSHELGRYDK